MEKNARNFNAAREWYKKALEIRQRLVDKEPDNVVVQQDLSLLCYRLGDLEISAGNTDAAKTCYEKTMEMTQKLVDMMEGNPKNIQNLQIMSFLCVRLGDIEKKAGNIAAARERYEKAMEITQWLAGKLPGNVQGIKQFMFLVQTLLDNLEK